MSCNCKKEISVKVKKLAQDVELPFVATHGSAGADLRAYLCDEETNERVVKVVIPPNGKYKIHTKLAFQLPENHVMLLFPRSSMGIKKGLELQNTVGVLDSDYTGECLLFVKNTSEEPVEIEHGERIAQAVILPYPKVSFTEVEELEETERGAGGFGSTGVK